ncbi:hypothetical protein [Flindersiella endophytica]
MQASSAVMLPVRAAGLLGRYWAPLIFWFALGYIVHDLVLRGSAWLSYRNVWLGFGGLSVSVLVMLAATILMFQSMRPGLTMLRNKDGEVPNPAEALEPTGRRPMVDAIAESILPFLVFYGAWGLFTEEVQMWGRQAVNQDLTQGMDVMSELGAATGARALIPLLIAVGSWLVRALFETIYNRRGGRLLGLVTAFFEANFMFFSVFTVYALISNWFAWLAGRMFWANAERGIVDMIAQLVGLVPGLSLEKLGQAWAWLTQWNAELSDDFLQPLLWLTIAGAVYGFEMARDEQLFTRLSQRTGRLAELFTREWRDKWTPLVNGIRLIFRAGLLFYLTFCLLYLLTGVLSGWIAIGVKYLIGPHPWSWWWPWLGPVDLLEQGIHEVLRIALLAAAFGMALERGVARSQAKGKRRAYKPAVTAKDAENPAAPVPAGVGTGGSGTPAARPGGGGAPAGGPARPGGVAGNPWPGERPPGGGGRPARPDAQPRPQGGGADGGPAGGTSGWPGRP